MSPLNRFDNASKKLNHLNEWSKEVASVKTHKSELPSTLIKRLLIFERETLYTDPHLKWESLRSRIIREQASPKLNKKLIVKFPDYTSRKFDPFDAQSNLFLGSFRRFLHHKIASIVLASSLHTQKERQEQDRLRSEGAQKLLEKRFATLRFTLEDGDGIKYDAILSGKINDIINGNFVFRLGGNNETYEMSHYDETRLNHLAGFATLQVNGPGVGRSQGQPSYANMVNVAKMGVKFLEELTHHYRHQRTSLKGRIVLKGFSLGNGVLSETLRWYKPNTDEADYLVYSVNTFSRLSDVPSGLFSQHIGVFWIRRISETICSLGNRLFRWVKFDFDAVRAARLLTRLNIPQAIMQASVFDGNNPIAVDDGVVTANASLLNQVTKSGKMHKKLIASNLYGENMLKNSTLKFEETHCIENVRWSHSLLKRFDDIILWAKPLQSERI